MKEKISNKDVENNPKKIEVNPKNIEDNIKKIKENSERQKLININERVEETFGNLEGKVYKKGDNINFMYMGEDGKKQECTFNINKQIIEYQGKKYKVDLPDGANLDSVEFNNGEIILTGSVVWFSGKGKTSQFNLYNALGNVFDTGYVEIATDEGKKLSIKEK